MAGPKYRIKLYGHTSKNLQSFLRHLASILKTDEDGARRVLMKVPVVIKEGIDREKAQSLQEALTLIDALCLIEPTPGEKTEPVATDPAVIKLLAKSVRSESTPTKKWTSKIWLPLGLGVATVLLVWIALAIISSHRLPSAHRPASSISRGTAGSAPAQGQSLPYEGYSKEELVALMEELRTDEAELRISLEAEQKALVALYNQVGSGRDELRRKKRDVVSIQNRLSRTTRKLRSVERRIQTLNRATQ